MDIEWGEHSKKGIDEKNINRKTVEQVLQNSPYIYDMANEKYSVIPENENHFLTIGYSKDGEFSKKPMTVYFGVEGTKIKPYIAGPSTKNHIERFQEQREVLKANPLREVKKIRDKEPLKIPQKKVHKRDSALNKLHREKENFKTTNKKVDKEKVVQAYKKARDKNRSQKQNSKEKSKNLKKGKERDI